MISSPTSPGHLCSDTLCSKISGRIAGVAFKIPSGLIDSSSDSTEEASETGTDSNTKISGDERSFTFDRVDAEGTTSESDGEKSSSSMPDGKTAASFVPDDNGSDNGADAVSANNVADAANKGDNDDSMDDDNNADDNDNVGNDDTSGVSDVGDAGSADSMGNAGDFNPFAISVMVKTQDVGPSTQKVGKYPFDPLRAKGLTG